METSIPHGLVDTEQRIIRDKFAKFKGAARVLFQHLEFPHPTRQIDRKAIRQLIRTFDGEGCIREEPSHRIPVIVDNSTLQVALEKLSLTAETFKATADHQPFLELESGVKLECLHGQHRVLAAKEHLAASQWWWVVDIYGTDLNENTKQALREGYSYSAKYTSGEMFRYMRLCNRNNDPLGAQRWRKRFSPSQDRFLKQLLERPILLEALDSILCIQGVWREFYIGSLDVFLFPKCDEEIAHYIKSTKLILTRILDGDPEAMTRTDPTTIESIQSRSPALSKSDYDFINENMGSGELFPEVVDPVKRADIAEGLLATKELISSLYTLIKDIRYLKQPAELLSKLLPESRKKSLRQRWFHQFTRTEQSGGGIEIQQGVSGPYKTVPSRHLDSFDVCYQQLWLCSYRVCKYPNAYSRQQLADLASHLGFLTPKIKFEISQDPAQAVIEKALRDVFHTLRPNEKFNFDANKATRIVTFFKEYINSQATTPIDSTLPPITVTGKGVPLSCRCGHGRMDTQDLTHLFLDKIHAPLPKYRRDGEEISSFYVKRSRHIAFFGTIDLAGDQGGSSIHVTSASSSLNRQPLEASRPAVAITDPIPFASRRNRGSDGGNESHQVVYKGEMVRFFDNEDIREVPFEKEDVNSQAREYADLGKRLYIEMGNSTSHHFVWSECYDILRKTGKSTVILATVVESRTGKRRWGEDTPEQFQAATKEAFEFDMDGEEER